MAEAELAVDIAPGNLILAVALVKHTELKSVVALHPSEIVVDVDCGVGLLPGSGAEVASTEIGAAKTTEAHVWDGCCRIEQRQVNAVLGEGDVPIGALGDRESMARTDGELIQERCGDRAD